MSKKPIPLPSDERPNPLLQALTPTSIGTLSAAVAVFGPKFSALGVGDIIGRGSEVLPGLSRVPHKLYLALVGFLIGYTTTRGVHWLRWEIIRSLLTYKGWVYGPKTYTTQAWALLMNLVRGPKQFHTFAYQPYLPKQPLPDLDKTLDRYLKTAKHFLSVEEFEQTVEVVEEFRETTGPKVQAYLQEKARKEDNWVADYWINLAYLAGRDPIAVNNNYYLLNGTHETLTTDPLARAATTIYCHMQFHGMLQKDEVQPVILNDMIPLCMHGFRYIFNTVRVPGETIDRIQRYPASRHIIVIRKGHYFKVDMAALDRTTRRMRILTPEELYQQFTRIQQIADALPNEAPVAALTSQNRTLWAKQREVLRTKNEDTLHDVEAAMFHISLDDYNSKNVGEFAFRCITGNGDDRWFDKCFTIITSPTGTRMGWNIEHTVLDAMVFGVMGEHSFVVEQRMYNPDGSIKRDPRYPPRDMGTPNRLEWDVSDMKEEINTAYKAHVAVTEDLDLVAISTPFGKGVMKKCRVSPDGFIQMVLQLAYYRLHKEIPKTYEPSTCRLFLLGRTETVHPISADSVAWVKSMDDPNSMQQTRQEFLRRAIKHQTKYRLDATVGDGCDRHLLALFCASRELGMDIPKLFMDKAWRMPFKLSTSQTPTKMWEYGADLDYWNCAGGFGPSCHDGYGVSYIIMGDEIINMHISSWKSCGDTDSGKLASAIEKACHDMKALFFS